MEPDTLNRIGIILNFLAGFLLAPELLGTERLKRLEGSLERAAAILSNRDDLIAHKVRGFLRDFYFKDFRKPSLNLSSTELLLEIWKIALRITLILIPTFTVVAFVSQWLSKGDNGNDTHRSVGERILILIISTIALPLLLTITLFIAEGSAKLTRLLVNKLEGDNRLRSMLVWLGIICFIVGNTLQFIATF